MRGEQDEGHKLGQHDDDEVRLVALLHLSEHHHEPVEPKEAKQAQSGIDARGSARHVGDDVHGGSGKHINGKAATPPVEAGNL